MYYSFGGTNGLQWFNDVWSYDPRTNAWAQMDCVGFIPQAREGHAATLINDVMYVFGGRTDEGIDLGDLVAFRIPTRRWYLFQNMGPAPSPRSGHSMTAFGRQIIAMAGEPSSSPREPTELSLVYVLDTTKIRYPPEQQPVERGPAPRKASGDRFGIPAGRSSRQAQVASPDLQQQRRLQGRESIMSPPGARPGDFQGSRLPRASISQTPSGPPPAGQAPTPGPRGTIIPVPQSGRGKPPPPRINVPSTAETVRSMAASPPMGSVESPTSKELLSREPSRPSLEQRPPSAQKMTARAMESGEAAPLISAPTRQRSLRHNRQRSSIDSTIDDSVAAAAGGGGGSSGKRGSLEGMGGGGGGSISRRNSRSAPDEARSPKFNAYHEPLLKELEMVKGRNAWYASELALARKAGYTPNPYTGAMVDLEDHVPDTLNDEDRSMIEAFLSMKAELGKMQATVDRQAAIASKRIAEVEHQRDAALSEATYARTKLAAHGGSIRGTPASELDEAASERNTDISRRLATALASQAELKSTAEGIATDLEQEKSARALADETCEATRKRLVALETQTSALEAESLRAELHQIETSYRQETLFRSEAETSVKQLIIDKDELLQKLEESSARLKDHGGNLGMLREAVVASAAKVSLIEKHLDEERELRGGLERKLLQLRSEYDERTADLENATRRLREAEDLADTNAREAETHKTAFLTGLGRASSFDSDSSIRSFADQRVTVLEAQVEKANTFARANQAAADEAMDKLRRAEERILGLEAYQEQSSREGLQLRRQLQGAMKDNQALAVEHSDLRSHVENHQRDASALAAQHSALKDLLGERGVNVAASASSQRSLSRLDSPGPRLGTPEQTRLREVEQQLASSLRACEEMKASYETREQEADRTYRDKLEQLETDYQSAVHYVKGTEKMLKRMKDELVRYKAQNSKVQSELNDAQRSMSQLSNRAAPPSDWEVERMNLQKSITNLQQETSLSLANLEKQVASEKQELAVARMERERYQQQYESSRKGILAAAEKSREELEQLKRENSLLESRATDAEQKVSMLLDQVGTSVGNYRRQSHLNSGGGVNGISRRQSDASSNTVNGSSSRIGRQRADSDDSHDDSGSFLDNRGSLALDSLANELEALRSHWESTNRSYRLSSQLDLDHPSSPHGRDVETTSGLSESVADWRRRLDEEEQTRPDSR